MHGSYEMYLYVVHGMYTRTCEIDVVNTHAKLRDVTSSHLHGGRGQSQVKELLSS